MSRFLGSLALLCALAGIARPCPVTLGPKLGLSVPNLRGGGGNEISSGYSSRLAFGFGLVADIGITPRFSIEPELNYVPQGAKRQGMQPIQMDPTQLGLPPDTKFYADFKDVAKLNYLEIPVLAKYHFGAARRLYADFGPNIGILLSASEVTSGTSSLYLDAQGNQPVTVPPNNDPLPPQDFGATTNTKGDLRRFNWGIQGGVGGTYPFGPGDLCLDARGGIGLVHVQKDVVANGDNTTGVFLVTLGYLLPVGGRHGD